MLRTFLLAMSTCLMAQMALAESALDACWAESANRVELGSCLAGARTDADARLDEAYAAALDAQGELDAIAGDTRATRTLERAQTAFGLFRDLQCEVQALQMGSGTGSGDAYVGCWIDMTRARADTLSDMLPGGLPDGLIASWRVAEIGGDAAIAEAQPTIAFTEDGQINGNAGCNGFFGPADVDGDEIEVSELLGVTMMTCGPVIDDQESRFFAALQAARRIEIVQDRLVLRDGQGAPVLRLDLAR